MLEYFMLLYKYADVFECLNQRWSENIFSKIHMQIFNGLKLSTFHSSFGSLSIMLSIYFRIRNSLNSSENNDAIFFSSMRTVNAESERKLHAAFVTDTLPLFVLFNIEKWKRSFHNHKMYRNSFIWYLCEAILHELEATQHVLSI